MFASRRIYCIFPTVLKSVNSSHILSSTVLNRHVGIGYVAPVVNKSVRFHANNATHTTKKPIEIENIYYGLLTPQIKAVKIISLTTSAVGIIAQPILFKQVTSMGGGLPVIIGLCSFIGFFTFVTPFLLHYITKKYITNLDYNPQTEKYIATVLSFFCRKKQIEFSLEDVNVPEIPGMFTSFHVKGKPVFVDPSLFINPMHYGKIMGYDKPIDLKLSESSNIKKS